jgi:ubiquinone/menaquinone biosynthesis C-methylase UbiE
MLEEAKKLWPSSRLLQCEGGHLPFKNKSVDHVLFITSFEYMPDAVKALSEAKRVAKKGILLGFD